MSERKISYLNRTFEDYRDGLRDLISTYYPDISADLSDASIGSWLIDLVAAIGDNLSYHIDSVYTETNIETAQQANSMFAIAKTNGLKVPGPKGAMTEVKFSIDLKPSGTYANSDSSYPMPNWFYAPIIKKGTRMRAQNGEYFELTEDVDFDEQFNSSGISDRTITPYTDSNGQIKKYTVTKTAIATAGQSEVYREVINASSIGPFMEIVIPRKNVMNIESIIFKVGTTYSDNPTINEFMYPDEYTAGNGSDRPDTYRFFEVDSLLENYRWGDDLSTYTCGNQDNSKPKSFLYSYLSEDNEYIPTTMITKGEWIPLTQKFITEYDENGYMRITFGAGEQAGHDMTKISDASDFSKAQISKMVKNNALGKTPIGGTTMFILYRVGGGYDSNIPANTLRTITYLNYENKYCMTDSDDLAEAGNVKNSLTVTNTTPSVSGKDMPSSDELRYMIKYNNSEQNRCVTLKDYESRIQKMPPRYGCPFRTAAIEENNKVMLYLLNIDNNGKLSNVLPTIMTENIQNYMSMYRSINDFVEIKAGRIINISIEADVFIDKNYTAKDVIKTVITTIQDYLDINKHYLGEDIYIGDLEKEIGNIDGVLNVIEVRVYNNYSGNYSDTLISQTSYEAGDTNENRFKVDLDASDYVLYSDADEMFEIKYPETDIKVKAKVR